MKVFSAADVDAALTFPALVDALAEAFRGGMTAPTRHHHPVARKGEAEATHLLMPAWSDDFIGVKIVNVFPGNGARGLPAVQGTYVLQSGVTGEGVAVLDGTRLTQWRTAAASALAARHLARVDASKLLLVGAGALAPFLARAHASQRPIDSVEIWNHRPDGARKLAERLSAEGLRASAVESLEDAVRQRGDALGSPSHSRRVAAARPAHRSRRRLQHAHARGRRFRAATRARLHRHIGGAERGRRCRVGDRERSADARRRRRGPRGAGQRRPGAGRRAGDHAVQIGRRGDRGSRGGDAGLARLAKEIMTFP
jgi:hypothetical protein